jgi:hypothetical protein
LKEAMPASFLAEEGSGSPRRSAYEPELPDHAEAVFRIEARTVAGDRRDVEPSQLGPDGWSLRRVSSNRRLSLTRFINGKRLPE